MILLSYTGETCVEVAAGASTYMYIGVIPKTYDKLKKLVSRQAYGKAWNLLRQHTCIKKGAEQ